MRTQRLRLTAAFSRALAAALGFAALGSGVFGQEAPAPQPPPQQVQAPAPDISSSAPQEPPKDGEASPGEAKYPPLAPPPLLLTRGLEVQSLDAQPIHTQDVIRLRDRLPSGKDRVAVDIFHPPGEGKHGAVIVLHGTHGPGRAEKYYLGLSEDLARHGYVALFVRYYDRGRKGRGNREIWARTIGDTLSFAATLPDVDPDRLALLGYSQGAFLALNDAPSDPRIRAVIAYYGGLSPGFIPEAQETMPPTLLFHGTADRIVPVRRSVETLEALRGAGRPADLVVYVGAAHGFNLNSKLGPNALAAADSWQRTLEFLDFHLRYPAWTPAVLPLADVATASSGDPPPKDYFSQEPLQRLSYLHPLESGPDGKAAVYVNPTPDQIKAILASAAKARQAHHGSRSTSKKSQAQARPKPSSPAPKEREEVMP
jgi:carboxymethylenebutenolidase